MRTKSTILKNNRIYPDNQNANMSQHQSRIEMWKQLLNSRKAGNVLLKGKLANIIRNNFDPNMLDEIEDFQTRFITEDELIDSLRREINELDNLQNVSMAGDEKMEKLLETKMDKMAKDITNSITSFCILKSAFNNFRHKISGKREN